MAARPLPALVDDLIIDILLRLPPDDIACLTRASLVCKTWRRIISDGAFLRRYREIHGAPPFLGFLYSDYYISRSRFSPFIPTTPACPFPPRASAGSPTCCRTLDCRHGRVLVNLSGYTSCLIVWDPVTGLERRISAPVIPHMAAVLCASNGCEHLDCSNGPYLVVLLAETRNRHLGFCMTQTRAHLYSSETRNWSVSASIHYREHDLPMGYAECSFQGAMMPSLLAGGALFFMQEGSRKVLKYDVSSGFLSVILAPPYPGQSMILCTSEDGGLGVATVEGCSLRLLNGRINPDGRSKWKLGRVIELDSIIPKGVGGAWTKICVAGFAEGTGYIFVRANDGIFRVELKSGRISKIGSGLFGPIFPLMGFYIPDIPKRQAAFANKD